MTTVACVFVRGHVPFTAEYVVRLAAMVARWMDRPYRFVCLTDQPQKLPADMETIAIPSPAPMLGWWSKMRLFSDIGLRGRVLYLDLDTLLVASLQPIVDFPAAFALVPDGAPDWRPKGGHQVVKRFNSSCMVWDVGCAQTKYLWSAWSPDVADRLHGDQDFLGEQSWDAATMPAQWFPRLSEVTRGPTPDAKVILVKVPKNLEASRKYPWFKAAWKAA